MAAAPSDGGSTGRGPREREKRPEMRDDRIFDNDAVFIYRVGQKNRTIFES